MKYCSLPVILFVILASIPNTLLAEDYEQREKRIHEEVRQHWADVNNPVPPGDYTLRIDDLTFSMTIPQGRTAASYNRKDIDTQNYREQISEAIKVLDNHQYQRMLGLIGFWRKDQTGIWPFVSTYGATSIGTGLYLAPEWESKIDRTSDKESLWADYRTLESLVKKTKGTIQQFDAKGNRLGRKEIPRDVVVINGRQWAREHYEKAVIVDLPEETLDTYYTGVSENSYIRLLVRAPYTASRYPKDKERPEWVKQSSAFIAQALTSIKISAPSGSTEPDFFTVDESLNTPIEVLVP